MYVLLHIYGGLVEDVRLYEDEDKAKDAARSKLNDIDFDSERSPADIDDRDINSYQEVYVWKSNSEKDSDDGWGTDTGVLTLLSSSKKVS